MMFLLALISSHVAKDLPRYIEAMRGALLRPEEGTLGLIVFGPNITGVIFAVLAFVTFLAGLIYTQMGVSIVIAIVKHRAKRREGSKDFFLPAKIREYRLAILDPSNAPGENGRSPSGAQEA